MFCRIVSLGSCERDIALIRTKLSRPFAIDSHVCPVIRPVNLLRFAHRKDGLYREGHPRLADAGHLALGVMRDPRRGMEMCVDAVATPGCNDFATSGLGMLLDDGSKVSYRRAGLHNRNGLVQAFSRRFNYPDRIWVRLGSIADIVGFVEVSMISLVIDRYVEIEDVTIEEESLVGYPVADHFVWRGTQRFREVIIVQRRRICLFVVRKSVLSVSDVILTYLPFHTSLVADLVKIICGDARPELGSDNVQHFAA